MCGQRRGAPGGGAEGAYEAYEGVVLCGIKEEGGMALKRGSQTTNLSKQHDFFGDEVATLIWEGSVPNEDLWHCSQNPHQQETAWV